MEEGGYKVKRKKGALIAIYIGAIVGVCILIINNMDYIMRFQQYGYIGLFVMNIATTFLWPMPPPYLIMAFTLGGLLNPFVVGIVSGSGLCVSGIILYYIGRGGRKFLFLPDPSSMEEDSLPPKISRFMKRMKLPKIMKFAVRRGAVLVFLMSLLPNPLYTPAMASMGAMRFRLVKFVFASWSGHTIKCVAIAYLGYLGLNPFIT